MSEAELLPLPPEESRPATVSESELPFVPHHPTEARVRIVLTALLAFCVLGSVIGTVLYIMLTYLTGWPQDLQLDGLGADFSESTRWQIRTLLALSHLFTFLAAGVATVYMFYRRYVPEDKPGYLYTWRNYLGMLRLPDARIFVWSIILMAVSIPLVLFAYQINQLIPIPDELRAMEEDASNTIRGLLQMDSGAELFANLMLIALLPAVGEELIFRGILQNQLMRRTDQPVSALLLTAVVFSFIHFQFEGFLPRVLLGLLLGWLYWRTANFWIPVAAHFFNNALQVVAQYLYKQGLSTVDLDQDIDVHWAAALLSAAGVALFAWLIHKRVQRVRTM